MMLALKWNTPLLVLATVAFCLTTHAAIRSETLQIPAYTAYMLPESDSARFSEKNGITQWKDAAQTVNWFGKFEQVGTLAARVQLKSQYKVPIVFRLTIQDQSREVRLEPSLNEESQMLDFGQFNIATKGYHSVQMAIVQPKETDSLVIQSLHLDGAAAADAHFNLKERRNAASVHLMYTVPTGTNIAAFYTEVTAIEDPTTTFYMACGWHRGYFGMQVNSPTQRRIIFSVWDSGSEAVDRKKVASENRVTLVDKGEGVFSGDFGNEGTGGHSHLKYLWKTGEAQKFVVTAQPAQETYTIFSGYWYHPEKQTWMLISSWKAPGEGGWMKRPHSFSENFGGSNGHLLRKALFGNQWLQQSNGTWLECTQATFSHDPTGRADRFDRWMGVEGDQFFLSHGGYLEGFTKYGEKFERPATHRSPEFKSPQ